jgi:hypothetical protein
LCREILVTIVPRRILLVCVARADRSVHPGRVRLGKRG